MKKLLFHRFIQLAVCIVALSLVACAGKPIPEPTAIACPEPIHSNTGEYMCPFTQDGVLAEWTDMAINAKIGSTVGQMAGAYAGQKTLEFIPFVGGLAGSIAGDYAGKAIAIEAAGGGEFIKSSSDLSFNNVDDMAVYMYVRHSNNEHYASALEAAMEIYPELGDNYTSALQNARTL